MSRSSTALLLVIAPICAAAETSDDLVLDLEDPWTIAAITILSLLGLLLIVRACTNLFSITVETETTAAPTEVVVETRRRS